MTEEATTWHLPPKTSPDPFRQPGTSPVNPNPTAEPTRSTGAAYVPPAGYYTPAPVPQAYVPPNTGSPIKIGEWLSLGWHVYAENWGVMTAASIIGGFLSVCTAGILAGPLLMSLQGMAFKTLKGERPQLGDLFNFDGKFFQALLAFIVFAAIYVGLVSGRNELFALFSFVVDPFLTIGAALTLGRLSDGQRDFAASLNDVARRLFTKDGLMWWIAGLVFMLFAGMGSIACFIGLFVTFPWIVSAGAVAYRDTFKLRGPNDTMQ